MKDRGGGEKLESSRSKEHKVLGRGRALPGGGVAGGGGDVEEKEMGLGESEEVPSQTAQPRALIVQIPAAVVPLGPAVVPPRFCRALERNCRCAR